MLNKKRVYFFATISALLVMVGISLVLGGCSDGGGSGSAVVAPTTPATEPVVDQNAITAKGVRYDVQQYIEGAYPNSAKKREALYGYARTLQTAYTAVNTQEEAVSMEPKIIRALSCISRMTPESSGSNDPLRVVGKKTSNTPERLAAQLRYEKFLDGKVFTISSSSDTIETVCDFDPNSLPN